jgi:biopolymer transport protein ExbD
MKIPSPGGRKRARIEIIPLIDVVFFLLATFVMVSLSMVKNQGVAVNLPSAASASVQQRASSVTVTVTQAGEIYFNQELVGLDEMTRRLRELKSAQADLKVFIHGDQDASFGSAVGVLDEVRKLGITKVAIQTQGKKS